MTKKLTITGAVILIVVGLVAVSISLASSGAVSRSVDKYNLLNMIDGSKNVMADMNKEMDLVKASTSQLNGKLDVLAKVVSLLDQQVSVVNMLNATMGEQKPLLTTTNGTLDEVQSRIDYTLAGSLGMRPTLDSLLASMGNSINVTSLVVDGMAQLAAVGSVMSGQLDNTLRYLSIMQPAAAKAHRAMAMIPMDLTALSGLLPAPASAPAPAVQPQVTANETPSSGVIPGVSPLVEGVGRGVRDLLQGLTGLLFRR